MKTFLKPFLAIIMLGTLMGCFGTDNDQTGDPALAVYMPGPNSYTGDDVVELHCHGGTLSARRTLNAVITNGARMAEPGEFTYRAFMNGKMDLTQAEAVADLINAHSEMALHMAERQVDGVLKDIVNNCYGPDKGPFISAGICGCKCDGRINSVGRTRQR